MPRTGRSTAGDRRERPVDALAARHARHLGGARRHGARRPHQLAIGAVNEKIEGFFDTCAAQGLTGEQGVLVPAANVGDLMLRHDVVEACERGEFHVWSVETIHDALTLFFGRPAGAIDPETGFYPPATVLHAAMVSAFVLWRRAQAKPEEFEVIEKGEGEAEAEHDGSQSS